MDIKNNHDFGYLVATIVFLSCMKALTAGHWWGHMIRRPNAGPMTFIASIGLVTYIGISVAFAYLLWLAGETWLIVCPLAVFVLTARYQRRKHNRS